MPDSADAGTAQARPTEARTAELFVRSLSPSVAASNQRRVRERLAELQDEGPVASVEVSVWGRRVPLDEDGRVAATHPVAREVAAFRAWAAERDRRLAPVFERRTCRSSLRDERQDVLVLPVLALAEYRDGDLVHVAPTSDGASVTTVADRLTALEAAVRSAVA